MFYHGVHVIGITVLLAAVLTVQVCGSPPQTITITKPYLVPESFDYLPSRGFILGSIGRQGVNTVSDDGTLTVLNSLASIGAPSSFGIQVDPFRPLLYVATGIWPLNSSASFQAGMATIDLTTNTVIKHADLTGLAPNRSREVFSNDMDVDRDGNVFVTDTRQGVVYKVTPFGAASVYVQDSRMFGTKSSVNPLGVGNDGLTFMPGSYGKYFLVGVYGTRADGSSRLLRVSHPNPSQVVEVTLTGDTVYGADGIYPYGGKLYITGNLVHDRLYVLTSTDDWLSATVTSTAAPSPCTTPTAPVARDGNIFLSCASGFGAGPFHVVKATSATPSPRDVAQEVVSEYIRAALSGNTAKAGSLLDPHVVLQWHGSGLVPGSGTFSGISGYQRFFGLAFANFKDISFTGSKFVGTSDSGTVVLQHDEHSVATSTNAPIANLPNLDVYKVDTSTKKITHIDTFLDSMAIAFTTCSGTIKCNRYAQQRPLSEWPAVATQVAVSDGSLSADELANKNFVLQYLNTFLTAAGTGNFAPVLPYLNDNVRLTFHAPKSYFPAGGTHMGKSAYFAAFGSIGFKFEDFRTTTPVWVAVAGNHIIGTWLENSKYISTKRALTNGRNFVHYTVNIDSTGTRTIRSVDVFFDSTKYASVTCPGALVCEPLPAVQTTCAPAKTGDGATVGQVVATVLVTGIVFTGTAIWAVYSMMPTNAKRGHAMSDLGHPLMTSDA